MCDQVQRHNDDADRAFAEGMDRRSFIKTSVATTAAVAALGGGFGGRVAQAGGDPYAAPAEPALPQTDVTLKRERAAVVVTDPQNDFLKPGGAAWAVVKDSVQHNGTIENIERLLKAAKGAGITVAISPHYYYPYDHGWRFGGPLEKLMHSIGMFDRKSPLSVQDFEGSGADFLERYKPYLLDGETIIASPHKVYGPDNSDLVLQLRKAGVDQVVLAGMSANLCVESHLRELLEQGFEVAVVKDATAAAKLPEGDGYLAAIINFRYIANALWTTDTAIERIKGAT